MKGKGVVVVDSIVSAGKGEAEFITVVGSAMFGVQDATVIANRNATTRILCKITF